MRNNDTIREHVADWVLLNGDRRVVAGALTAVIIGTVGTFIYAGQVAVGPNSSTATVFGSGLVGGVITLLTIALSINQLILARVFDSINTLTDRLKGSRDLRQSVEELARVPSSPNDPAAFLSLIATTLSDRASGLLTMSDTTDWDSPAEVTSTIRDIAAYGDSIDAHLEVNENMTKVLSLVL